MLKLSWPSPTDGRAMILPPEAHPLVQVLALHFTSPTYQRVSALLVGALVKTGRRTVTNVLRTLGHLAPGYRTDYPRVLSRAPWSGLALGCALVRFLLDHIVPNGPVLLAGDNNVDGHPGPHAYGKARHRDAVRSSHPYTAWRYGTSGSFSPPSSSSRSPPARGRCRYSSICTDPKRTTRSGTGHTAHRPESCAGCCACS